MLVMKSSESIINTTELYKPNAPEPIRSFNLNLPPTLTMFTSHGCGGHSTASGALPDCMVVGIVVQMVVPTDDARSPDGQSLIFFPFCFLIRGWLTVYKIFQAYVDEIVGLNICIEVMCRGQINVEVQNNRVWEN